MASSGGRPSAFRPEYIEQARKLCLLGCTDVQLAEFFGVSEQTIYTWKKRQPGFVEALKSAKESADAQVASRLWDKAVGYEYKSQQAFKLKRVEYNSVGKRVGEAEEVVNVPVTVVVQPDTTAAIFWLKNRRKQDWRDKYEHEVRGEIKSFVVSPAEKDTTPRPDLRPDFD